MKGAGGFTYLTDERAVASLAKDGFTVSAFKAASAAAATIAADEWNPVGPSTKGGRNTKTE